MKRTCNLAYIFAKITYMYTQMKRFECARTLIEMSLLFNIEAKRPSQQLVSHAIRV